jgi:hypothetical protein
MKMAIYVDAIQDNDFGIEDSFESLDKSLS